MGVRLFECRRIDPSYFFHDNRAYLQGLWFATSTNGLMLRTWGGWGMNRDEGSPQRVIAGDRIHELDDSLRMLGGIICLNDIYFIQMTTRGVASIACCD